MTRIQHIGVLTGGGDCPGMNAALRAIVKAAVCERGIHVTGFLDGFAGLTEDRARPLGFDDVAGIIATGGTMLGTSNRYDPFRVAVEGEGGMRRDCSDAVLATLARRGVDGLVVVGGDGSLRIADRISARGVPVIGVPKTIDNDVAETDVTIGFDSARAIATEAVDRLRSTAASHHRIMVLEVMGRHAGWIALEAGMAGGSDVILLPEIPFGYEAVARGVRDRMCRGRSFSLVVVAEGARSPTAAPWSARSWREAPSRCGWAASQPSWAAPSSNCCRPRSATSPSDTSSVAARRRRPTVSSPRDSGRRRSTRSTTAPGVRWLP